MVYRSSLYLVPTPIGNLGDITLRALEVLQNVDAILAEDTRTAGLLLKHYQIRQTLASYHAHNEHDIVRHVVAEMLRGKKYALITDAGTPSVSDPGYLIVRSCIEAQLQVECLPGASAFVPALVVSGLPADRFVFEGFLPAKKGRISRLQQLTHEKRTIVLYESPHKLVKCLTQLAEFLGENRKTAVCRELTKMHEEVVRGTIAECIQHFTNHAPKGEIVIVIEGKKD